jgi:hypothetical protein
MPGHRGGPAPERFKPEYTGIVVEFQRGPDGRASGFRILEGWAALTFVRSKDAAAAQAPRTHQAFAGASEDCVSPRVPACG